MLRYLTTVKLFGGAAVALAMAFHAGPAAAKTLNVYPVTAAYQSIAGAVVCLGLSERTVNKGPQTTGSGGIVTFYGVSEIERVHVNVIAPGIGTAKRVMELGTDPQVEVTVPGQVEVPAEVRSVCVAASAVGTTTTTLPPPSGVQPSPGIVYDRQRAAELILKANYFQQALYPVYSHPRCVNCHGRVNAATGANHPSGVQTSCVSCHRAGQPGGAPANWGAAHAPSFVGLSWQQVCTMVKNFAGPIGRSGFNTHVSGDLLIRWAFAPTGIRSSPSANPNPPLQAAGSGNRNAFVTNSLTWFDQGMQSGLQPYQGPLPFRR